MRRLTRMVLASVCAFILRGARSLRYADGADSSHRLATCMETCDRTAQIQNAPFEFTQLRRAAAGTLLCELAAIVTDAELLWQTERGSGAILGATPSR
jgi:hypothetical protein